MRVGDGAQPVPIGSVAAEVRHQERLRALRYRVFDRIDVDLEAVGLDVDEDAHTAGADDRREIGRERQR